ncbi:MAG: hypothetical protein F6J90_08320 [Moorea sp. SIOASIH]|nr:hypothetical protein [Moorena sp. SIOASIH]NEO36323.1 hypothetical protein [Moorena sp. SIOASIH]
MSVIKLPSSELTPPDSRLPTPDSRLPTPDSLLPNNYLTYDTRTYRPQN